MISQNHAISRLFSSKYIHSIRIKQHSRCISRWLKQTGLDGPELGHLKRIRKHGATTSLLLCTEPNIPQLPQDLNLPAPYLLAVPVSSALTLPSLALKSALWPTTYTPRRKDEPELWTRGKLKWAWDAMKSAVDEALRAQRDDREVRLCLPDVDFPPNVSLTDPRRVRLRSCPSLLIFQNPSTLQTLPY